MKTSIFVPTNRLGGLDVLENSLVVQSAQADVLIVCDEHYLDRENFWDAIAYENSFINCEVMVPPVIDGENKRNLARAYNYAAELSLFYECDLMISWQDYIHIPVHGIERFQRVYQELGDDYLYTGLTSISKTPGVEEVTQPNNIYSVFKHPYSRVSMPTEIQWWDVRYYMYEEQFKASPTIVTNDVNHWEANWAAIPVKLFERGLRWNEEYDKGYAYENNDLAKRAVHEYGCQILIDKGNHAVSLPHFDYWPQEKEDLITYSNRSRFEGE